MNQKGISKGIQVANKATDTDKVNEIQICIQVQKTNNFNLH